MARILVEDLSPVGGQCKQGQKKKKLLEKKKRVQSSATPLLCNHARMGIKTWVLELCDFCSCVEAGEGPLLVFLFPSLESCEYRVLQMDVSKSNLHASGLPASSLSRGLAAPRAVSTVPLNNHLV